MPDRSHPAWPHPRERFPPEGEGRAGLAWAWLRRDPHYRGLTPSARRTTPHGVTVIDAAPDAVRARWGCLTVEDACLSAPGSPMAWDPVWDVSVLRLEACRSETATKGATGFDIGQWAGNAVMVIGKAGDEHALLRNGTQYLHLHIIAGTLLEGPVALRFDIGDARPLQPALASLTRFLHLHHRGAWLPERALPARTVRRMLLALQVHDARHCGASIRDIGIMLFGRARVEAEWRDPGESLKSQCRRLIGLARHMAAGGYRELLKRY